jgi:FkbM family methyltransferase
MYNRLYSIRDTINPKIILDIGANIGEWNMIVKQIFPIARIISFEANKECEQHLKSKNLEYKICLLGDEQKEVTFFSTRVDKTSTGCSIYRENTEFFNDSNLIEYKLNMEKLDDILDNFDQIDLIKIDVQGAELDVLRGAKTIMNKTKFIILEVSMIEYNKNSPLFADVIDFMNKNNFLVNDILDIHYSNNVCIQCDILFKKLPFQ